MNWLIARLKEKSTWLALFTFAGLFGINIEPELREYIINAIIAVAAVAAFVFKEPAREHHQSNQIPPIELQGRSLSDAPLDYPVDGNDTLDADCDGRRHAHQSGYRVPMQPESKTESPRSTGWNG